MTLPINSLLFTVLKLVAGFSKRKSESLLGEKEKDDGVANALTILVKIACNFHVLNQPLQNLRRRRVSVDGAHGGTAYEPVALVSQVKLMSAGDHYPIHDKTGCVGEIRRATHHRVCNFHFSDS